MIRQDYLQVCPAAGGAGRITRCVDKVELLGLASAKRGFMAPDVPDAPESGFAEFTASAWFALAAPPGTPATIASKLNEEVLDIMKMPNVKEQFAA